MWKKLFVLTIFISAFCSAIFSQKMEHAQSVRNFRSIHQFEHILDSLGNLNNSVEREKEIHVLWKQLKAEGRVPFIINDSVAFLYFGKAQKVSWAGDFNGWNPGDSLFGGKTCGKTDLWILKTSFPSDARLDYKIVADNNWILDPANPFIQYSGFGPNSELRMPSWKYPQETISHEEIPHGQLSENYIIKSKIDNLSYKVQYRIYTPYEYEKLKGLPVVYVLDGEEYLESREGSMLEVLDNLIYGKKIIPLIAVFIDPRDPDTLSHNRRMNEYRQSKEFLNFVCNELVPLVDSNYRTSANADSRLIMGASLGGWTAAWFGMNRPDLFHCIGIQSPAFTDEFISIFSKTPHLPLKLFMSTGIIHDTEKQARKMKSVLEEKKYPLNYIEVSEGHSWGNWRALIKNILIYFFDVINAKHD